MWPVGYIIESPYSPFRLEQEEELPQREWRDAFEDLISLESGGVMISPESRREEKAVAAKFGWQRARFILKKLKKSTEVATAHFDLLQKGRGAFIQDGFHEAVVWADEKIRRIVRLSQLRYSFCEELKNNQELRKDWSASMHKDRGQWIASLITRGALTGWTSTLADSADGEHIALGKVDSGDPEDKYDIIRLTEHRLHELFDNGKPLEIGSPDPPLYRVSYRAPKPAIEEQYSNDGALLPPPDKPIIMSRTPDRPYLKEQTSTAERITLPNGKMATKVTLKNYLTNGETEEKVIIQEPGKVLQEVQRVRALIEDRMLRFD